MPAIHRTTMRSWIPALALLVSVPFAGCEPNDADEGADITSAPSTPSAGGLALESEANVVASFDAPDGRQLKVLEAAPGIFGIVQAGRLGDELLVSPQMVDSLNPDEIYETVSGMKPPARLQAALVRAREMGLRSPRAKKPRAPELDLAGTSQALSATPEPSDAAFFQAQISDEHFFNTMLACYTGAKTCRGCTGARDIQYDDVASADGAVLNTGNGNLTGSFKMRTWYTWGDPAKYDLQPGYYTKYDFYDWNRANDFDAKIYVNGAGRTYTACLRAQKPPPGGGIHL